MKWFGADAKAGVIPYDMFDVERDAATARRMDRCERIYHKGQELAWNGQETLATLLREHGGVHVSDDKREALRRVFSIIFWGELAAWKISLQLADGLEPLEARMAATSQAHDEARHFYVMHDYLKALGYEPSRLDRAPEALLVLVLETPSLAHKLLGMQLLIETVALTIFQTVRELRVEPVLTELLKYFERDEARHVGLGMQYLPELVKGMSRLEVEKLFLFQARLLFWAIWEGVILDPDFRALGVPTKQVVLLARAKQVAAIGEAFETLGEGYGQERAWVLKLMGSAAEFLFPEDRSWSAVPRRFEAAWEAFWKSESIDRTAFDVHAMHPIRTARGAIAEGERLH